MMFGWRWGGVPILVLRNFGACTLGTVPATVNYRKRPGSPTPRAHPSPLFRTLGCRRTSSRPWPRLVDVGVTADQPSSRPIFAASANSATHRPAAAGVLDRDLDPRDPPAASITSFTEYPCRSPVVERASPGRSAASAAMCAAQRSRGCSRGCRCRRAWGVGAEDTSSPAARALFAAARESSASGSWSRQRAVAAEPAR